MGTKVLITGEPGVGKTTVIKNLVQKLGERAIGFWTEEVRDKKTNKRVGFRIVTTEGKSKRFASKTFTSKNLVGSYGVNVKYFEELALPILQKAIDQARRDRRKVIVIDEIGKMELFSRPFRELVREIFYDDALNVVATIPIRDVHKLVSQIRRLPGVVHIHLTKDNREFMPDEILKLF